MSGTSKLDFIVSLIDKVSGPAGKIMSDMDKLTRHTKAGFQDIGYGIAGIVGAGSGLAGMIEPAGEMNRALGDVKSLGVADDVLEKLRITSRNFALDFGESASSFVSSAYDIQSAIAGLSGNELASFTQMSAILAKGTKANVGTITDYVGTMYGIFQTEADKMGRAQWVEQLAAQTAMAVNIFKSDGMKMAQAFEGIGATATQKGIALPEQFAVLGQLQATMSGSEAATKYGNFLTAAAAAGDSLKLKFTDSNNRLLSTMDILDKIRGKFGGVIDENEAKLLGKAFGDKEAVKMITLLKCLAESQLVF